MTDTANNYRSQIEERIQSSPSMPSLCQTLITNFNNPNLDFRALSEEMKFDPGTTANILKLANSAYFGSTGEIDSLQTAFVRLGMKQLFQVVAAQGAASRLSTRLAGYDLMPNELLRHSVWVAIAAEELAKILNIRPPEMIFTIGLLHDMGKVLFDEFIEKEAARIHQEEAFMTESFDELETEIFGTNHAHAGADLIAGWNFPEELIEAVRWHHCPNMAKEHTSTVDMIHVADMLAYSEGLGTGIDGLMYRTCEESIKRLGLKSKIIERVASKTLDKMEQLERLLK